MQSVVHLANGVFFDDEIQALNADHDASVFAWASAAITFSAAFVLVLLWLVPRGAGRLLLVAVVLAFFSLDDVGRIHERVGTAIRSDLFGLPTGWGRLVWPAIFLPLLAVAFVVLWRLADGADRRVASAIRLGLVLLGAAVAAEVVSAPLYISEENPGWPGRVEVALDEGAELAGWILLAAALTCLLTDALVRGRPGRPPAR